MLTDPPHLGIIEGREFLPEMLNCGLGVFTVIVPPTIIFSLGGGVEILHTLNCPISISVWIYFILTRTDMIPNIRAVYLDVANQDPPR